MSDYAAMRLFAVAFPALLCQLVVALPAAAFCRLTTDSPPAATACATTGVPLEWRRQCIEYSLTDTLSPDGPPLEQARELADRAFVAWTAVQCASGPLPLSVRQSAALAECVEPEYNTAGRNANSVIFVDDWAAQELPPAALGLAELWHEPNTGEIFDADMRINQSRGVPAVCDERCPPGAFDLLNVLTHEAGHFFGLGHSDVPGATMEARAGDGEIEKRSLEEDDREGVCSIYGELLSPSCDDRDFAPDNGFAAACMVPAPVSASSGLGSGCTVAFEPREARLPARLAGGMLWGVLGLVVIRRARRAEKR